MKTATRSSLAYRRRAGGFSLVEIAVAVGLFAFGVVGVIGLFPAALAQRADAARDTRARVIAEQVFESLRGSNTEALIKNKNIVMPPMIEMAAEEGDNAPGEGDLRRKSRTQFPFCLGFGETGTAVVRHMPDDGMWNKGVSGEAKDTVYIARAEREGTSMTDLYKITVEVGFPANLPAEKRRNVAFTSLVYMK